MAGLLSFVGLGPGDPRLRTERAASRLAEADEVLAVACTADILAAALARVREGQRVVRPVYGDPYGSASAAVEIALALQAGVAVEVVPGVDAEGAAGAFAAVVGPAAFVAPGQLRAVLEAGPPNASVTVIAQPSRPTQRVWVGALADALKRVNELEAAEGEAPLIVAWGAPRRDLGWFERRPLFSKRILVTRAREQASALAALLAEHGAEPIVVPTIAITGPQDSAPLAHALQEMRRGAYAWVAFTSANGVARTWSALRAMGADARAFGAVRLAAIGPATAAALEPLGLRADVVAREYRGEILAEGLLAALREGPRDARVLLARAAKARDVLPQALRDAGFGVDVVAAYETTAAPAAAMAPIVAHLEARRIDAVTFTSSSTVERFCEAVGPGAPELLSGVRVASIGPITTQTAEAQGITVDVTAREFTISGLVQALSESYGSA